jgi:predicted CXXCH cytochrome family protein
MNKRLIWFWWFGILSTVVGFAALSVGAGQEAMRVVQPQNKTYVIGSLIHLVVAADPAKIDRISFAINKKSPVIFDISGEKKNMLTGGMVYQCSLATLEAGDNKISFYGYWRGNKVAEQVQQVYYAEKFSRDKNTPPSDYRHQVFHTIQNEAVCLECHAELGQADKKVTALSESPCYRCHAYEVARKDKHGPAAVGECTVCHNPGGKEKYAVDIPIKKLCSNCHDDAIVSWEAMKYLHGPTATGDCSICHSPHSSDERFFLHKKTNDLCIGCHEEKASGRHVVAGFSGKSHPVAGKSNPLKPDRGYSCASCHSPHAANSRGLFALDTGGGRFGICQTCHKK